MCGGGLQSSCILLVMFLNSDTISNMPVPTGENAFSFCSLGEKHIKGRRENPADHGAIKRGLLYLFNFKEHLISSGGDEGGVERVGVKLSLKPSQKNENVEGWARRHGGRERTMTTLLSLHYHRL